jgi:hypothetical protein
MSSENTNGKVSSIYDVRTEGEGYSQQWTPVDREEGVVHAGVDIHSQFQKLKTECIFLEVLYHKVQFLYFVGESA